MRLYSEPPKSLAKSFYSLSGKQLYNKMKTNSLLYSPTGMNVPAAAHLDGRLSPREWDRKDIETGPDNEPVVGLRQARFAIQGMTCTACTHTVSSIIGALPGVESVEVHIISNQAIVAYRPDGIKSDQIINAIEDGGFGAVLGEDEDLEPSDRKEELDTRSVDVEIHGYNQDSILIIEKHLAQLGVLSFTPITAESSISRIVYRPSRDLTIRHILDFPSGITATVYHRPSIHRLMEEGQRREARTLLYLLTLSSIITVPTFVIGVVGMTLLPKKSPFREWCETTILGGAQRAVVALFVLGTISQLVINQYFVVRAWKSLSVGFQKAWQWSRLIHFGSMDLLVALSTTIAYLASVGLFIRDVTRSPEEVMKSGITSYFDSCVVLSFFILIGRVLEHYTRMKTNDAIALLEDGAPDHALLLIDEKPDGLSNIGEYLLNAPVTKIPADNIEVGDFLLLPAGAIPSADGTIVAGSSAFDESSLTGESLPVQRAKGDQVMTGTTNLSAPVVFQVETVGQETMMQKIVRVVAEGQYKKSPLQVLAERITSVFVPVIVYVSLLVLVVWLMVFLTLPSSSPILPAGKTSTSDRIATAFQFAIAVLVIACPCGIGLAAPTAHAVGSGLLAKAGILAQGGGEAFQLASGVNAIVFDKTGTLTMGNATVAQSFLADEEDAWLWEAVSIAEATSTHPLAQAIVSYSRDKVSSSSSPSLQPIICEEVAGRGMRVTYDFKGEKVSLAIGNDAFIIEEDKNVTIPDNLKAMANAWRDQGCTVVFVLRRDPNGSSVPMMLGLVDQVRPGFTKTISTLTAAGKEVYMLTGDNERTAHAVARQIGLDEYHVKAGAMPLEKAQFIQDLKTRKRISSSTTLGFRRRNEKPAIVAFAGDGLNDSAALAAADVGIALSHGSQVSIASASFIILSDRSAAQAVTQLFRISSRVFRRQILNFGWAMLYNVALIPVAAGVLYPYRQTQLSPVWSSLAMALSSVSVVVSSLALKWGL